MDQKVYSQGEEQKVILETLGDVPGQHKLLDIGAWDPATFSNTRALIDLGWIGTLVEPAPGPFNNLVKHYKDRPDIGLVQAVVAVQPGWVEFWDSGGDAVSSTEMSHVNKWKTWQGVHYRNFWTWAITPTMLLDRVGYDFEFINIDAEATSARIFMQMPVEKLTKCRCMCIEHDNAIQAILGKVQPLGFKHIWNSQENLIIAL